MTNIVPQTNDENINSTFEIVILGKCISDSAFLSPYYQKHRLFDKRLDNHGLLYGGDGAIQAMVATRMSATVALITRKCSDDLTQMCFSTLRYSGVCTEYVVPCYDSGVTDANALTCECGFKRLDGAYLTAADLKPFEHIIKAAKVVIVNYEIGFSASLEALQFCRDSISILYASPLPNINAKRLFSMVNFVLFDGKKDLERNFNYLTWLYPNIDNSKGYNEMITADHRFKTDRKNPVANLLRYSLEIGAKNAIVICNSVYTVYSGIGCPCASERKSSVYWISHYPTTDLTTGSNSAAYECIVSLAIVLVRYCTKFSRSDAKIDKLCSADATSVKCKQNGYDLDTILQYSWRLVKHFSRLDVTKGICTSEIHAIATESRCAVEDKNYFDLDDLDDSLY